MLFDDSEFIDRNAVMNSFNQIKSFQPPTVQKRQAQQQPATDLFQPTPNKGDQDMSAMPIIGSIFSMFTGS